MMFPGCFHYANMNQNLLLLFLQAIFDPLRNFSKIMDISSRTDTRNVGILYVNASYKVYSYKKFDFTFICHGYEQLQNVVNLVSAFILCFPICIKFVKSYRTDIKTLYVFQQYICIKVKGGSGRQTGWDFFLVCFYMILKKT